jgi:hypothetical protein
MKDKIVYLLVFILVISSIQGINTSAIIVKEDVSSRDFTHTVIVEVATAQTCKPCHYWNQNIYDIYNSSDYDFYYVEMIVFDDNDEILNDEAADWFSYYGAGSVPKNIMDGDYRRIGNNSETFIEYLNDCGSRDVVDISASMIVSWLGNGTIQVDVYIKNNEGSQYNGHIRASITEIVSRYNTLNGDPYHFGFLGFAFDEDISIPAGGVFTDSIVWDSNEHMDNHGDDFGDIVYDNIQVVMGVFNDDDGFVDETVMARVGDNDPPDEPTDPNPLDGELDVDVNVDLSWQCSDPDGDSLTYDVYFGTTSPPPLVESGHNSKTYDPGILDPETTYYWKIVAWDLPGDFKSGPIWDFTTSQNPNSPPLAPTVAGPSNPKIDQTITFTFNSVDPDGDDVRFIIDWDDSSTDTTTFVPSGGDNTASHAWSEKGTYYCTVKGEDEHGAVGEETIFTIVVGKSKAISTPFLRFLQSHPFLYLLLQKLIQQQFWFGL